MPEETVPNWLNEKILKLIKEHWSIILNIVLAYSLVQVVQAYRDEVDKNDKKDAITLKIVQDNERLWRQVTFRTFKIIEKNDNENGTNTDSLSGN